MGNWPLFYVQKNIFSCWPFLGIFLPFKLEPNVDLSPKKYFLGYISIHAFLILFHSKFLLYKKCKLSIKVYLLLIYTFMCMIIFLMIIVLSFQSHQTRMLNAGLGMAWNWYGLSCIKGMYIRWTKDSLSRRNLSN